MTDTKTLTAKINTLTTRVDALVTQGTGTPVIFSATTPATTTDGALWIDTANGNVLKEYVTGTGWVTYQFGTNAIADAAVTSALIAGHTITAANIASATITSTEIATGTITAGNIAAGTITANEISGSANITGTQIATATITGSNIAGTTITASNIANATITTTQISGSAGITGSQIGTGTITGTNIASATITGSLIDSGTITGSNIATGTITASQIANATITGTQIASGTIAASNITSATITNAQIAAGTITGSNIGSSTITGANIDSATITNVQIANGTITTTQISSSAGITGTQIATGTVTDSNIAAGTITAASIASGTITASLIAANTITAAEIDTAIVIAGIVDGTTVSGSQLIAYGTSGQLLIYSGTPTTGNLIGSWSGAAGTDSYSNDYPTGLKMTQGSITGVAIDGSTITTSDIIGGTASSVALSEPDIDGGTMTETEITFDSDGGLLLVYTSTTTTHTETAAGDYTFTVPSDVTKLKVECWGGGAGGDGGLTSQGGNGGGGGEYAAENQLAVTPSATYSYTVGGGGVKASTGTGHGADGGDSFFNGSQVRAHGGLGNGGAGTGSTNTVHHDGGAGGTTTGSDTGAGSGGNSGNSSAAGNDGNPGSGTSGGAQPASQTGSGRGGAGGSNGNNGSGGSGPGGGGGGAGAGSSTITNKAISYGATWQATYYGPDATGGNANDKRTSDPIYQGGETASGGTYNGTMRTVIAYNRAGVASDFSGYTITRVTVQLKNQHSWYSSGCGVEWSLPSASVAGSAPSTFPGSWTRIQTNTMAEYETKSFDIGSSHWSAMVNSTNAIGLGCTLVDHNHDYDLDYYSYFDPSQTRIKFWGTQTTGGSTDSGAGADGQVKITYTSGRTLVCVIAPATGTDGDGNDYAAGYTGEVAAFQPGSSPKNVESWHAMSLSNGWSTSDYAEYKRLPGNLVMIRGNGISGGTDTGGTTLWTAPTGYVPSANHNLPLLVGWTTAPSNAVYNTPKMYMRSTGALSIYPHGGSSGGTIGNLGFCCIYPLD